MVLRRGGSGGFGTAGAAPAPAGGRSDGRGVGTWIGARGAVIGRGTEPAFVPPGSVLPRRCGTGGGAGVCASPSAAFFAPLSLSSATDGDANTGRGASVLPRTIAHRANGHARPHRPTGARVVDPRRVQ
jgi:hypothetical protein